MGVKMITTEEYRNRIYNKYGDNVKVIGEHVSILHPMEIISHCELNGDEGNKLCE